jgi:hypothetical protein
VGIRGGADARQARVRCRSAGFDTYSAGTENASVPAPADRRSRVVGHRARGGLGGGRAMPLADVFSVVSGTHTVCPPFCTSSDATVSVIGSHGAWVEGRSPGGGTATTSVIVGPGGTSGKAKVDRTAGILAATPLGRSFRASRSGVRGPRQTG